MVRLTQQKVVVLVGGVGGAKLALGLQQILPPENLTIIVNTGDDFWHYGLRICPDLDTVLYTLSGRVDPVNGWGLVADSTTMLDSLRSLGEEPWFRLGDKDLATHLFRTHHLRLGWTLTQVVGELAKRMQIAPRVLPMTDSEVATIVNTREYGELEFQEYFVRHRWQPHVMGLRFAGVEQASISNAVREAIQAADVILIGPSNPWLSISPILSLPEMRELLRDSFAPKVALTPIVQGTAIKGPAAKLMAELGYPVSAQSVAEFYGDLLTGYVYDERDTAIQSHAFKTTAFDTIMVTDADKARLAQQILQWIAETELA